jgi:hypothetical protein
MPRLSFPLGIPTYQEIDMRPSSRTPFRIAGVAALVSLFSLLLPSHAAMADEQDGDESRIRKGLRLHRSI